jgi:hypothetical protein
MVGVKMGDDQGVDLGLVEAELSEAIPNRLSPGLPVGATVEEEDPSVSLDGIGVDPLGALEGEWRRDEVDAVAQGAGLRDGLTHLALAMDIRIPAAASEGRCEVR